MTQMSFGKFLGTRIEESTDASVVRVDAGFFDVQGLKRIAAATDHAIFVARFEQRRLNPLEGFALEVLTSVGGFKDAEDASAAYKQYLESSSK